jgi:hypothetical protein
MKLKNKKTGEIRYCKVIYDDLEPQEGEWTATSLAELNEEWEDVPEGYWWIDGDKDVIFCDETDGFWKEINNSRKEIGNYFETKEEAEKAVKKLEAWKRLKDAGFRLTGWYGGSKTITYDFEEKPEHYIPLIESVDLDLLFGGEE